MGLGAIAPTRSAGNKPGPDSPKNKSAPLSASSRVVLISAVANCICSGHRSVRSGCNTPSLSKSVMALMGTPILCNIVWQAMPAAPAPKPTIRISFGLLSAICNALVAAAATTIAVPCWSSWNTGIFILSRQIRSTIKQSGALMSSRLTAPNVGSSLQTKSASASGSASLTSISKQSRPANFLNRTALPSITGLLACAPILPRPSTAVPFVITATKLPLAV